MLQNALFPLLFLVSSIASGPGALQEGGAAAPPAETAEQDGGADGQETAPELAPPGDLAEAIALDQDDLADELEALEPAALGRHLNAWMALLRDQESVLERARAAPEGSEDSGKVDGLTTDRNTLIAGAEVVIAALVAKGGDVGAARAEIDAIRDQEAEKFDARTTVPADQGAARSLDVEVLKAKLRPMRRERLQGEVEAWLGVLQDKAREIASVEVAGLSAEAGEDMDRFTAQAVQLRAERDDLLRRVKVVVAALEDKGGDAEEARAYVGSLVATPPLTGFRAALVTLRAWALSREGGIRVALNLGKFLAILVAFRLLSAFVAFLVSRTMKALRRTSALLQEFLVGALRKLVMLIGFVIAMSQLGVDIGPLLAAMGAAGFVIGFALQGTISNFASGLMLMMYRPFEIGDLVDVGGVNGKVAGMSLVSTTVRSPDNQVIIVPNNKIWGDVITNKTASPERRVDMIFGIGYGDDGDKARELLLDICASHEKVLREPETVVQLHELGDSSVNFICRPWVRTEDYWTVYWDVQRLAKQRFDAEGISIPFPQRDVHLYQTAASGSGAP